MDLCRPRYAPAVFLFELGERLHDAAAALRALGLRLDRAMAARANAAADRLTIEQMSESQLRDIGLGRRVTDFTNVLEATRDRARWPG